MVSPNTVMGFEWSFLILAYAAVATRIYVRIWLRRDKLRWSDIWLIVALVCVQGLLVCDTLTFLRQDMNNFTDPDVPLMKIRFATNYFFDFGIYFPKFSILAVYYAIVPPLHKPKMRMTLYALTFITVGSSLFTLFADTFWCGPDPSVNWNEHSECTVWSAMDLMRANWSLNFATEILNILYPFPLIADLKISTRREKISLGVIFAMGFITLGVSIGRFITMHSLTNAISVYIWATAEFCTSIIIVAMTAFRPLLRKLSRILTDSLVGAGRGGSYRISSREQGVWDRRTGHQDVEGQWGEGIHQSNVSSNQSNVTASHHYEDFNGSHLELTGLVPGKIMKTKEVTVSSETMKR